MNFTDKENIMLYKYLGNDKGESVTEFEHQLAGDTSYDTTVRCGYCNKLLFHACVENYSTGGWLEEFKKPCEFIRTYPGSDADIAEKIDKYYKNERETEDDYRGALYMAFCSSSDKDYQDWLEIGITPQDKIQAAMEVWKRMEDNKGESK